ELFITDRSVLAEERISSFGQQIAPEHRQVDRRVAPADVDPVDDAGLPRVSLDEHLAKVEVAVDDRRSLRVGKALRLLEEAVDRRGPTPDPRRLDVAE